MPRYSHPAACYPSDLPEPIRKGGWKDNGFAFGPNHPVVCFPAGHFSTAAHARQARESGRHCAACKTPGFRVISRRWGATTALFGIEKVTGLVADAIFRWPAPAPALDFAPASAAMSNIVYFDLETQRSAEEVGGWDRIRDMRMSVGVTFSTARGTYEIYEESRAPALIEELRRADLVVGYNILRFDYEVLTAYNPLFDPQQVHTLDMLVELSKALPHRLSLDAIAAASLGVEKTGDGLQALRWFRQGKLLEIAEYCCYDVKLTRLVHEYGREHKRLFYTTRFGRKSVPVAW